MQRPLFLEGEAGVGKTEIAKVLAQGLQRPLVRLQCYRRPDLASAAYEWNYPRQMLEIRLAEVDRAVDHVVQHVGMALLDLHQRLHSMPAACNRWAVPLVANSSKPIASAAGPARPRAPCVRLAMLMKTLPLVGSTVPAANWLLAKAIGETLADAHHFAGRFHFRSQHHVDAGELGEGEDGLLDRELAGNRLARIALLGQRDAGHHLGGHLGQRHAGGLRDEGHRAAGPRDSPPARRRSVAVLAS